MPGQMSASGAAPVCVLVLQEFSRVNTPTPNPPSGAAETEAPELAPFLQVTWSSGPPLDPVNERLNFPEPEQNWYL